MFREFPYVFSRLSYGKGSGKTWGLSRMLHGKFEG